MLLHSDQLESTLPENIIGGGLFISIGGGWWSLEQKNSISKFSKSEAYLVASYGNLRKFHFQMNLLL